MSITLRPWAVAVLIATFGILVGFSASQITSANSNGKQASASASNYQVVQQLRQINSKLGATYRSSSVIGKLDDIMDGIGTSNYDTGSVVHNTYETCKAVKGSFSC